MTDNDRAVAESAYDRLADSYAAEVETNPYNADLDLPGTTALLPDVAGERILDAVCGTGVYTEWLLEHGGDVVGIDVSEAMLAHARDRLGGRATLCRVDLGSPLGLAEESFDEFPLPDDADYFAVERRVKEWSVDVPYYRRPLSEMIAPLLEAGFRLEALSEPQPTDAFREKWPERYEKESRRPVVLCLRARIPDDRP